MTLGYAGVPNGLEPARGGRHKGGFLRVADTDLDRFVALAFCRADLLFELDETFRVVFAAGAAAPLLGASAERLKGRSFFDLVAAPDRRLAAEMLEAASRRGRIDDVVLRLAASGGTTPAVAVGGYRVPDFNDHFFIAVKSNPVYQSEPPPEAELGHDAESGLMDAEAYATIAAERAQAFQRAGGRPQITVLRLDRLDEITSRLGASDRLRLCRTVGEILSDASLGGNTAARVAPDAFSYLHPDTVNPDEVGSRISEAAHRLFDQPVAPASHTLDADGAGMSEQQVAKAIALTIRKYCDDTDLSKKKSLAQVLKGMVDDTIDTVAYLRKVVANRDFEVLFMPVCDMHLEKVHHFEALARFRDSRMGSSPYHMFCLAEEVGIITELDLAVVDSAIRAVKAHTRKSSLMPPVAVNLSGISIASLTFVGELKKLLARSGVSPRKLMFEITESARIQQIAAANEAIQEFRKLGFRFCLDDFGSGAASFDYLNALDVDIVKFDGPVIKRACATEKGSELLASMARMCSGLGVRTCAEMVEDKRTAQRVAACGVDFGQGWYFGKADPDPFTFASRFVAG